MGKKMKTLKELQESVKIKNIDQIRDQYKEGVIFKIGETVETNDGQVAEIINRGTNYLTLVREGNVFKKWLSEVKTVRTRKRSEVEEGFSYKGYFPQNFSEELTEQFKELCANAEDSYAMFNCIRSIDTLLGADNISENFELYKTEFDRSVRYLRKFNIPSSILSKVEDRLLEHAIVEGIQFSASDKNKVASILAMSAGISPQDDPVDTVNQAATAMKNKKHTPEGWKIWGKMLNLATKAGIKWDKNIYAKTTQKFMELIETKAAREEELDKEHKNYGPYARWLADKKKTPEQLEKERKEREEKREKEGHGVFSAAHRELNPELYKK